MQQQEQGATIVFITSVSAMRPSPGTAAYGAAKAGLVSLAASLAVEWAPKVRLNCVAAGLVKTEQSHLHYGDASGLARVSATIPLGRLADPRDIGDACVFLASPLASYVSGGTLLVHGGGERPAFLGAARAVASSGSALRAGPPSRPAPRALEGAAVFGSASGSPAAHATGPYGFSTPRLTSTA
jgi:hypothetical protein